MTEFPKARLRRFKSEAVIFFLILVSVAPATMPADADGQHAWALSARILEPSDTPIKVGQTCRVGNIATCGWSTTDFGSALEVDGETIAVGHPDAQAIHVYRQEGSSWTHHATFTGGTGFGKPFALEGNTLVAGDRVSSEVKIFARSGADWMNVDSFSTDLSGCLGHAVDIREGRIIAGDPCNSQIHVLERNGEGWQQTATLSVEGISELGRALEDGGAVIYARAEGGHVYGFERTDRDWTSVHIPVEFTGSGFAADGHRFSVLAGSTVVVYHRVATHAWEKEAEFHAQDVSPFSNLDLFGWSLDLSGDTLIVGAPRDDASPNVHGSAEATPDICSSVEIHECLPPRPGAAYVFEYEGEQWSKTTKLNGDLLGHSRFGEQVAIDRSESSILVGAPYKVNQVSNQGDVDPEDSVYVFERLPGVI